MTNRSDTSRGSHENTDVIAVSIRNAPPGVLTFSCFHVSNVFESHSTACGDFHGSLRLISEAIEFSFWIAWNASGVPVGSGGIGPSGPWVLYGSPMPLR